MKTPFKLLDAFDYHDRDAYFGRSKEVTEQYGATFRTRLMLVYGLSGTGKTSLIQCGLANEFDGPDWYPIMMRPGDNIGESFSEALSKRLPKEKFTGDPATDIRSISRAKFRTVYLIIDQFEEFFTLDGNTREVQEAAMQSLRSILDSDINCRIMLVMREEYLGQLHPFEKIVPELFQHRFRVERMDDANVREVINQSFGRFNIHLEEPVALAVDKIVENSRGNNAQTDLPYLQVYLDMLYRDAFREKYGAVSRADDEFPELHITMEQIQKVGKIEDVLGRFLDSRERTYYRFLRRKYDQEGGFPKDGIATVLDLMVTDEGTKIPIDYERIDDVIIPKFANDPRVNNISRAALSELIYALSEDRIVRINPTSFELAHDSLAAIIGDRRTEEDKQLQFQYRRIRNLYDEFQASGKLLDRDQLISLRSFLPELALSPDVESFIQQSKSETQRIRDEKDKERKEKMATLEAKAEALAEAELQRSKAIVAAEVAKQEKENALQAKEEAESQKAAAERERENAIASKREAERAKRKSRAWMWGAIVIFVFATALGVVFGFREYESYKEKVAEKEEKIEEQKKTELELNSQLNDQRDNLAKELGRVESLKRIYDLDSAGVLVLPWSVLTGTRRVGGEVLLADTTTSFLVGSDVYYSIKILRDTLGEDAVNLYVVRSSGSGVLKDAVIDSVTDIQLSLNPIGTLYSSSIVIQDPGIYEIRIRDKKGNTIGPPYNYQFHVRGSPIVQSHSGDIPANAVVVGSRNNDHKFFVHKKSRFTVDENIWFYSRVVVSSAQPVLFRVRFIDTGKWLGYVNRKEVMPNKDGFRVRSFMTKIQTPGSYELVCTDEDGIELHSVRFEVSN